MFEIGPNRLARYPGGVRWACHRVAHGAAYFETLGLMVHRAGHGYHAHEVHSVTPLRLGPAIKLGASEAAA